MPSPLIATVPWPGVVVAVTVSASPSTSRSLSSTATTTAVLVGVDVASSTATGASLTEVTSIVTVAVPIHRGRTILGALQLSTQAGDIDAIVQAERMAIIRIPYTKEYLMALADWLSFEAASQYLYNQVHDRW